MGGDPYGGAISYEDEVDYLISLYDMDKDCLTHTWGAKGKLRSEKDLRNLYLQTCREKLEQLRGEGAL